MLGALLGLPSAQVIRPKDWPLEVIDCSVFVYSAFLWTIFRKPTVIFQKAASQS